MLTRNEQYQRINQHFSVPLTQASYVPFKRVGDMVYISGQLPWRLGQVVTGTVGLDVPMDVAMNAAYLCAQGLLYQAYVACDNDLDRIQEWVYLKGYVRCTSTFVDTGIVINAASNLIIDVFGESGRHTRSVIGVNSLPAGSCVEIEAAFTLVS